MNDAKRCAKENLIVDAAERVFSVVGFKNAKMENIATEAGITKVTLYSYFQSKENLYLALTYRGLQLLNDKYYQTIDQYKNSKGIDCVVALIETFMDFCSDNYLYSEALLDYFALVRSTSAGKNTAKLTVATKESIYYTKLLDIQNLPFKLTVKEIQRGQQDGSIISKIDPMVQTLHGWATVIGYAKVITASGDHATPLFNVNLDDVKKLNLGVARALLGSAQLHTQMEIV
jgi:AcrR family transcriptional regulator|tara:strand:- start:4695 stop:5387 length:693 start_codon:yes stop_codon:yes gene_type:complete